jgi:hypothetical protein
VGGVGLNAVELLLLLLLLPNGDRVYDTADILSTAGGGSGESVKEWRLLRDEQKHTNNHKHPAVSRKDSPAALAQNRSAHPK